MAEQLILCAENLLNVVQFPNHTLVASSEASGYTVDRLANGRRQAADHFEPNNTNTDVTITGTFDQPRGFNFVAIDRNSNHKGYRYQQLGSDDAFASASNTRTIWDVNTIPLIPGGAIDGSVGCVTDEGAWLKTSSSDAHSYVRVTSKAMGSGLKPQITGLWVANAFVPSNKTSRFPVQEESFDVSFMQSKSPYGFQGRGPIATGRSGVLTLRLTSTFDEPAIRYHVLNLYKRGFPMWICWRKSDAPWRALLATCPPGARLAFEQDADWPWPFKKITIPFEEAEPVW